MAPARKVYTRTGDDGSTALLFGGRVGKDSLGPGAYGAVDEAVSALGLARAEADRDGELDQLLTRLQRELFVAGAELATAPENRTKLTPGVSLVTERHGRRTGAGHRRRHRSLRGAHRVRPARSRTESPPRSTWRARSCAAVERESVAAANAGWLADSQVVPYLNRLADLVYTLARWQEGNFRPVRTNT